MILAIDPGNLKSAYVKLDNDLKPVEFGKIDNYGLIDKMLNEEFIKDITDLVIEMVASYGMPVGAEVFDTCYWIGKFEQTFYEKPISKNLIYRKDEKMNLCGTMKAKDSNIIQALKDRFGDKGTKKNPGWFYGFSKDVWQAYAVGVTYYDMYLKGE